MIINMNGAKAPETPSSVLQEKTVTPETLPTVIGADEGYDGLSQVTVNPDSQLKAENIRSGKTIFGVEGSFVGEPVYTNTIDYSTIKQAFTNEIHYPMGFVASEFSELGNTVTFEGDKTRTINGSAYSNTGLQSGAVCAYADVNYGAPFLNTSTYVPSEQWFHGTASFNGTYNCQLEYHNVSVIGENISHIEGTGWLCPVMLFYPYQSFTYLKYARVKQGYTLANVLPVTIDAAIVRNSNEIYFPIDIPSTEVDIYAYKSSYENFYYKAVGFAFIPNRIVIS